MKFSDTKYGDLTGQDVTIPTIRISSMGVDDLTGSPEIVRGDFISLSNKLINLKNSPREIYGFTNFADNMLESLEGNLEAVIGSLNISKNPLKTFKGNLRKVTRDLIIRKLRGFRSKEEIENALVEANIIVGGDIITNFGTSFRQDPKNVQFIQEKHRIGTLSKFL